MFHPFPVNHRPFFHFSRFSPQSSDVVQVLKLVCKHLLFDLTLAHQSIFFIKYMAVDWSSLPLDLLAAIAMKLETFEEFLCFSMVCRCWNRASSSIKHQWKALPEVPWLLLVENPKENHGSVRKIFNFYNNKCYNFNFPNISGARCWGSAYGWVAIAKRDMSIQLFNPITKVEIHFPSFETLPNRSKSEEFEEFHSEQKYNKNFVERFLSKVIVLKVPQSGRNEFVIMVLYESCKLLAFSRQGDQSWTSVFVKDTCVKSFDDVWINPTIVDILAVDEHVFVLYDDKEVRFWNVKEFARLELIVPMPFSSGFKVHYSQEDLENFEELDEEYLDAFIQREKYLLRSGNDLLMVLRYTEELTFTDSDDESSYDEIRYPTIGFKVYRFIHGNNIWEEIKDLGEVALFVGNNSSMSISTANARRLKSGCIYFTDGEHSWWRYDQYGAHDIGVYDIKCDEIRRFYEGDDTSSSFCSPTFFIPQF